MCKITNYGRRSSLSFLPITSFLQGLTLPSTNLIFVPTANATSRQISATGHSGPHLHVPGNSYYHAAVRLKLLISTVQYSQLSLVYHAVIENKYFGAGGATFAKIINHQLYAIRYNKKAMQPPKTNGCASII